MRGERSRFLGPGENDENIISDLAYKALDFVALSKESLKTLPERNRSLIEGFSSGLNRYFADHGRDGLSW